MEHGCLSLPVRCGLAQRTLRVRVEPFTLIAATTDEDLLLPALRSRFPIRQHLEFYGQEELSALLRAAAARAGVGIEPKAAALLAEAAHDTPRQALALFRCARDEAVVRGRAVIDAETCRSALGSLGIDNNGLGPIERQYLEVLGRPGKPVGLATLAARLGVSRRTLLHVHEPYLIRAGLVGITRHGRVLMSRRT